MVAVSMVSVYPEGEGPARAGPVWLCSEVADDDVRGVWTAALLEGLFPAPTRDLAALAELHDTATLWRCLNRDGDRLDLGDVGGDLDWNRLGDRVLVRRDRYGRVMRSRIDRAEHQDAAGEEAGE